MNPIEEPVIPINPIFAQTYVDAGYLKQKVLDKAIKGDGVLYIHNIKHVISKYIQSTNSQE